MLLFGAYRGLASALAPVVRQVLRRRLARGKEHPTRWPERLGIEPGDPRPAGPLVWIHGASVGETLSILPLLVALRRERPDLALLVTSGTVTSAALLERRLPEGVLHRFAPVDLPAAVARFLDRWRPDLAVMVESELWPNLLGAVAARRIPALLLNARLSQRSFARWRRFPGHAARLLGVFRLILAQSAGDATRLGALTTVPIATPGNLKYAADPLPADPAALATLEVQCAGRPILLAASTHPGEERQLVQAHRALEATRPDLLTIIAPRHPERGPELAALVATAGLGVGRRAAGEPITPATAIHVADTLGELGLFYRLAPLAFVGGSLIPHGGQNPLEPARLGRAVLFGPSMSNFQEIATELLAAGGAARIADAAALAAAVATLLAEPAALQAMQAAARAVASRQDGVLDAVLLALRPHLPKPAP